MLARIVSWSLMIRVKEKSNIIISFLVPGLT